MTLKEVTTALAYTTLATTLRPRNIAPLLPLPSSKPCPKLYNTAP